MLIAALFMALITSGQAQRVLGVSRPTLLSYIAKGLLTPLIDSRGWRWFDEADVQRVAFQKLPKPAELQKLLAQHSNDPQQSTHSEKEPGAVVSDALGGDLSVATSDSSRKTAET